MEVEAEVTVEGLVVCPKCNWLFTAKITDVVAVEIAPDEHDEP